MFKGLKQDIKNQNSKIHFFDLQKHKRQDYTKYLFVYNKLVYQNKKGIFNNFCYAFLLFSFFIDLLHCFKIFSLLFEIELFFTINLYLDKFNFVLFSI